MPMNPRILKRLWTLHLNLKNKRYRSQYRNQKGMLLHDYTIVEATFPFYSDYITISVSLCFRKFK